MAKQTAARKATNENSIQVAEAVIADLESKRAALIASRASDDRDMGSVAYRAHAHGDPAANDQLDEYVENALRHEQQLKSIDAAILAAKAKLTESKQADARAQGRKVAKELLKRADTIVNLAQSMDDANVLRVKASRAIEDELIEMRSLAQTAGLYVPSHESFLSLGSRADQTAPNAVRA